MARTPATPEPQLVLHLGGGDLPAAATVSRTILATAEILHRLGALQDADYEFETRVIGIRRGSILIGFILEALDELSRTSPTLHVLICGALFEVFRQLAVRLWRAEMDQALGSGPEAELAARALQDAEFRASVALLFENARSDANVSEIGIAQGSFDASPLKLPVGYFHDERTGLALPSDFFSTTQKRRVPRTHIYVFRASGNDPSVRQIEWWEAGRKYRAAAEIKSTKLLRRADRNPGSPIAVVDLEVEQTVNRATGASRILSAKIMKTHYLPDVRKDNHG